MKIAHVTATFPPYEGGTGNVCYQNALVLAKAGHKVTVFTSSSSALGEFEYPSEICVKRLPALFQIGNAPLLPGLLTLQDFDVIHLHHPFIFGAELIRIISRFKSIPYVLTHHNDLIGNGFRRYMFDAYSTISTRLVFSGAAKLIVVSKDHASGCKLKKMFIKRWADVVEVPNGVDTKVFKPTGTGQDIRDRYQIPGTGKVILFVGGLDRAHHFKGVDNLMRAFAQLNDANAFLMIIGEGDLKEHYMEFAAKLGVISRTIFPGRITNDKLPCYYSAADVTVLPSFPPESFGLVLIESLACCTPVIASRLPGVRTVVDEDTDGYLFEPGQVTELTEKLQLILSNPERSKEMGCNGRVKVLEKYDWSKIVERLEEVYVDVMRKGDKHKVLNVAKQR